MPDGHIRRETTSALQARYCQTIASIPQSQWDRLHPAKGEDWAYHHTLESVPPPGFKLGAIAVEAAGTVVAAAPVFQNTYRFDTSLQGPLRRLTARVHRVAPRLVSMEVLTLGSPVCDQAHLGFAPELPLPQRQAALEAMLSCLEGKARREGIQLVAVKGLSGAEADALSAPFDGRAYRRVTTVPNVKLELPYPSLDAYLASLPDGTARYLARKWRSAAKVRVEFRDKIEDVRDEVNALYASTLAQSRWDYGDFGPMHPDYFACVTRSLPENAKLMLCWHEDKLVSFQLFVAGAEEVLAKGIGMRYPEARELNLYFLNWREMFAYAIDRGIPRISMAGTTYSTKMMMGGRLDRQWIYFRFVNGLLNASLPWLTPLFDFESNDPELKTLDIGPDGRLVASVKAEDRKPAEKKTAKSAAKQAPGQVAKPADKKPVREVPPNRPSAKAQPDHASAHRPRTKAMPQRSEQRP